MSKLMLEKSGRLPNEDSYVQRSLVVWFVEVGKKKRKQNQKQMKAKI